jgi:hypothetical protein
MAAGRNGPSLACAATAQTVQGFTPAFENVSRPSITVQIVLQSLVQFSLLRMEQNIKLTQSPATVG